MVLRFHKVTFYSQLDEEMFFAALKRISAVKKIEGEEWDIVVSVSRAMSDKSLRELLGLFFRYRINPKQLEPLLTPERRARIGALETYGSPDLPVDDNRHERN